MFVNILSGDFISILSGWKNLWVTGKFIKKYKVGNSETNTNNVFVWKYIIVSWPLYICIICWKSVFYRQKKGFNDEDILECTITEDMIQCENEDQKVCSPSALLDCPVCYCLDQEYQGEFQWMFKSAVYNSHPDK